MNQHAVITGQTVLRDDTIIDSRFSSDYEAGRLGLRSSIIVPLYSKGQIIGTLSLRSRRIGAYGVREQSILERLADQVGPAIENADLYTQSRHTEEALRQSELRYRDLVNRARDVIYTIDTDGIVTSLNPVFESITGWACDQLIGLSFSALIHPDDIPAALDRFQRSMQGETLPIYEDRIRAKSGEYLTGEFLSTPQIENGKVVGILGIGRDITRRRRAEEALRESEERFRYLVESAADGFFVFDREGKLTDVNQRACELLGFTREELTKLSVWDIRADQDPPAWEQLLESMVPGVPVMVERLYKRKDGATFPVENCIGLIELNGDQHLFSIARDITERKQAEQTLLNQMRELTVAQERNRLARDLHDSVTQSLYSLTLFSETARHLAREENLERLDYYLTRLGESSQQALKEMRLLVHELRPLELENAGLIGALRQRLEAVESRAGIDTHLLLDGTVELPAHCEYELYRVAQEVLNNSLKHAAATSVIVRVVANGQRVQFEVEDNGKGFDPEIASAEGGMGLFNIRQRVEELGGALSILSILGEGTKVKVVVNTDGSPGCHKVDY